MSIRSTLSRLVIAGAVAAFVQPAFAQRDTPEEAPVVRVVLLAGQSNMVGHASTELLESQATAPETSDHYDHLRDENGWIERDDVVIKFLDRSGPLTIGYGARGHTGLELELGWILGDHFDEPVVLVKAAWGGHSLYERFRPPSSGQARESFIQEKLEEARKRVRERNEKEGRTDPMPTRDDILASYGSSYRAMLNEIRPVLDNPGSVFPELAGARAELTGFVWFQGWNDMWGLGPEEYETNLEHLINDVRSELDAPDLPVVIGVMGQNGSEEPNERMRSVQDAQLAMNDKPEFDGTVRAIRTDELVDKEAERLFEGWEDHRDEWAKVGSDYPYHYYGSGIWYGRIGRAIGEAMLELIDQED